MKLTIQNLRKSLSDCHIKETSATFKTLQDCNNPEYFLLRAQECLNAIKDTYKSPMAESLVKGTTVLAIQLLNMFKLSQESIDGPVQSKENTDPRS